MRIFFKQWKALLSIYIQDGLAYRAAGFIWTLTDAANAIVMPLVWSAAASSGSIAGFTSRDFVQYYLFMLLINSFVTSHFMWEVANEIKEGQFSTFLLRPISYYQFMLARNLAWRTVRTTISLPLICVVLYFYRGMLDGSSVYVGWEFWTALVLGHTVSVTFVMAMAMLALFLQEAQSVFMLYYGPMLFLSGSLFPIALLPQWAQAISKLAPFYFILGLPVEILVGRVSPAASVPMIATQLAWIVASVFAFKVMWHYGTRQYTGVGM